MRSLYVYLGGWAFILGMCFSRIVGTASANVSARPLVRTAFESISHNPEEFAGAVVLLWLAYTVPFTLAVVAVAAAPSSPRKAS